MRIELTSGVVVSVIQLDTDPRMGLVTALIALLLRGLSGSIRSRLIESEGLARVEAVINVVSRTEFDAHIDPNLSGLGQSSGGFAVTQSTDLSRSDQPPTVVICADDFGRPWRPDQERVSDFHTLFAELLRSLTYHLLAEEVEPEVLHPKIAALIQRAGYRGEIAGDSS